MTDHLSSQIARACQQLSDSDSRLKILIETYGPPDLERGGDPYQALVRSIIFQQISGKAATAILNRFLAIFPGSKFPTPQELSQADIPELRRAGLSQRKAEYVTGVGTAFQNPHFLGDRIDELSDMQIAEKLTGLRGVGQWTADMFMIFTMARMDVLPLSDQGIRNGMQVFFGLDHAPSLDQMLELTDHWKPYRSIASWYMWKVVDEDFQWQ